MYDYSYEISVALSVFIKHIKWKNTNPSKTHIKINLSRAEKMQSLNEWKVINESDINLFSNAFKKRLSQHLEFYPDAVIEIDYQPKALLAEIITNAKLSDEKFFEHQGMPFPQGSIKITKGNVTLFKGRDKPKTLCQA